MKPSIRSRLLFLSPVYPSCGGTGNQLRSAAIIDLLARDHDIDLIVITRHPDVRGPRDLHVESICKEIHHLYLARTPLEKTPDQLAPPMGFVRLSALPVDLDSPTPLLDYYQARRIDALFVYTLETALVLKNYLDRFPVRDLDLDELPSARQDKIAQLDIVRCDPKSAQQHKTLDQILRKLERSVIPRFRRVFVASEVERQRVLAQTEQRQVTVLPNILPPRPAPSAVPASVQNGPDEILFVGSLNYAPNEDAVLHFARDIFPRILAGARQSVNFRIVGANCTPALQNLQQRPGIIVTGYVDDLVPLYRRSRMAVVPLRAGGGTRLKILEAFLYGCPVVATTIGAEGLEAIHDRHLLLADTPEAFAQACLDLLQNPKLAGQLAENGQALIRDKYSAEALAAAYRAADGRDKFSDSLFNSRVNPSS